MKSLRDKGMWMARMATMAAVLAGLTGMAVIGQAQEPLTANTPATPLVVHDPLLQRVVIS
jgi:hypothetical protein